MKAVACFALLLLVAWVAMTALFTRWFADDVGDRPYVRDLFDGAIAATVSTILFGAMLIACIPAYHKAVRLWRNR